MSVGKIIAKMRSTRHPACPIFKNEIDTLEKAVSSAQRRIWYTRKVYPPNFNCTPHEELLVPFNDFANYARSFYVKASKKSHFNKLDLWSALLLFSEQIVLMGVVARPRFKDFDKRKEQNNFLKRMTRLVAGCSTPDLPSFSSFLEILCGGNLVQNCHFCNRTTTVEALAWSGKGHNQQRHSTVVHKPNTAPFFCCRRQRCSQQLKEKSFELIEKTYCWAQSLEEAAGIRCDYCFRLSRKVHR